MSFAVNGFPGSIGQRSFSPKHHYSRDSLPKEKVVNNESRYKIKVVVERHRPKEKKGGRIVKLPVVGWHCHVLVTDPGNTGLRRGGRTDLLLLLNPNAPEGNQDRVVFTYHTNQQGGLIHMNPYGWGKSTQKRVYETVEMMLGSRMDEMRILRNGTEMHSLLRDSSYRAGQPAEQTG